MSDKPNVHLSICALYTAHMQTMCEAFELLGRGAVQTFVPTVGAKLPNCRNVAVNTAYQRNPGFTHILMVDGDMARFNANHVRKLLEIDKPIAGIPYLRRDKQTQATFHPLDKSLDVKTLKGGMVIEADYMGTGFMLIKREVLDATVIDCEEPNGDHNRVWFFEERRWHRDQWQRIKDNYFATLGDVVTMTTDDLSRHLDWARDACQDGAAVIGSDIGFCWRARDKGFGTWAYLDIVGHHVQRIIPELDRMPKPDEGESNNPAAQ